MRWFKDNAEERTFSMNSLYQISGITKQGFYKQCDREFTDSIVEDQVTDIVKTIRKSHPKMGSRAMYHMAHVQNIGVNKFERYVSELGLGVHVKRKFIKTTDSRHRFWKYDNLTNGLILTDVNQLWCGDITYFLTSDKMLYIFLLEDVYSRRIIGWKASNNLLAANNISLLRQAFNLRGKSIFNGLIHHSDRGSQYCCNDYIKILKKARVKISMANNSLENPYAERLNGIVKNDYLESLEISKLKELIKELDRVVWFYNNERPHSELGYLAPVKFEESILGKPLSERTKMILHDFNR